MYERKSDDQVFYLLPVESVLGELPVVSKFRLQCANMQRTLSARHLTPERDLETTADGGTSTRGP